MLLICNIMLALFSMLILMYYFNMVFTRNYNMLKLVFSYGTFVVWQFCASSFNCFSGIENIIITIAVTFLVAVLAYNGSYLPKCIFVVLFNAIWMLMEIFCGYVLLLMDKEISQFQILGSMVSKGMLLLFVISLRKFFQKKGIQDLPYRYSMVLMIIPIGSIFVVNNTFRQSFTIGTKMESIWSIGASCIMLIINIIIFHMYSKIADELELKRYQTVYMKQMELYERQQQEREMSMIHVRDIYHNMKNNMISIIAYAQDGDCKKIIDYADSMLEMSGQSDFVDTGNVVIDSLVNYWHEVSKKENIKFDAELNIPMQMEFDGADLSMIIGNAFENAVEAARKSRGEKSVLIHMNYNKQNLFISVLNTYDGNLVKRQDGSICSSKPDSINHGIGIKSIERAVEKYNGVVKIETSKEKFLLKVLLYGVPKDYYDVK